MINVLSKLNELIATDEYIQSHFDVPVAERIAFGVALEAFAMPYIVLGTQSNVQEDPGINDRMIYHVDVYVDKGDIVLADWIAKSIEKALHFKRLQALGIGIFRESKVVIPDNLGIVHIHMKFLVRHFRTDLFY